MAMKAFVDSIAQCMGAPATGGGPAPYAVHSSASSSSDAATGRSDGMDNFSGLDHTFSGVGGPPSPGKACGRHVANSGHLRENNREVLNVRRRKGRALGLELHDREWDALFKDTARAKRMPRPPKTYNSSATNDVTPSNKTARASAAAVDTASSANKSPRRGSRSSNCSVGNGLPTSSATKKNLELEIRYSDVLARAKEAARPSLHSTPRKMSGSTPSSGRQLNGRGGSREEIFRRLSSEEGGSGSDWGSSAAEGGTLSKLVAAQAMCFAATTAAEDHAPPSKKVANDEGNTRKDSNTYCPRRCANGHGDLDDDERSRGDETLVTLDTARESLYMGRDEFSQNPSRAMPLYHNSRVEEENDEDDGETEENLSATQGSAVLSELVPKQLFEESHRNNDAGVVDENNCSRDVNVLRSDRGQHRPLDKLAASGLSGLRHDNDRRNVCKKSPLPCIKKSRSRPPSSKGQQRKVLGEI